MQSKGRLRHDNSSEQWAYGMKEKQYKRVQEYMDNSSREEMVLLYGAMQFAKKMGMPLTGEGLQKIGLHDGKYYVRNDG